MTQQPADTVPVPDRTPTTLHVNVVNDATVEVTGASPQEMIDLLQRGPDRVVVDGQAPDLVLDELTERQRDVLRLIASGLDNTEVAAQMFLSINTVKSYIRQTYRKIGVTTRSQAIIWAIDHGIVPAHPHDET